MVRAGFLEITPKLNIEYGIRQTITVPWKALWGNQIFFDPDLYKSSQAVKIDPKTGNVIPGTGSTYNGMVIPGQRLARPGMRTRRVAGLQQRI